MYSFTNICSSSSESLKHHFDYTFESRTRGSGAKEWNESSALPHRIDANTCIRLFTTHISLTNGINSDKRCTYNSWKKSMSKTKQVWIVVRRKWIDQMSSEYINPVDEWHAQWILKQKKTSCFYTIANCECKTKKVTYFPQYSCEFRTKKHPTNKLRYF